LRVGIGYDSHKFSEGRPLILAGVKVPYEKGLAGFSDADVITHAIIDALLGAAALGSIGRFFPAEEKYKDAYSISLLKETKQLLDDKGLQVVNIDATVILEEPRLDTYWSQMNENISSALGIEASAVNIKAKTNEKMGFVGRKEGIAAIAAVLLRGPQKVPTSKQGNLLGYGRNG